MKNLMLSAGSSSPTYMAPILSAYFFAATLLFSFNVGPMRFKICLLIRVKDLPVWFDRINKSSFPNSDTAQKYSVLVLDLP